MVPDTLVRFEPAPVVSYWTVTGLTAVPTGWTVISPLDVIHAGVDLGCEADAASRAPALVSVV